MISSHLISPKAPQLQLSSHPKLTSAATINDGDLCCQRLVHPTAQGNFSTFSLNCGWTWGQGFSPSHARNVDLGQDTDPYLLLPPLFYARKCTVSLCALCVVSCSNLLFLMPFNKDPVAPITTGPEALPAHLVLVARQC